MARVLNNFTLAIMEAIGQKPDISTQELWQDFNRESKYKEIYDTVFRLAALGLVSRQKKGPDVTGLKLTDEGKITLKRKNPGKDGVWKLVIFDIPEKQKYVRAVLRAKLKSLGFKKWQNSIWASPFALDAEIEDELAELSKKFFVRLIKTTDINKTDDLKKLFV